MEDHNLPALLAQGLCVTVNSDDPAYFGGYVNDNYLALFDAHPSMGVAQAKQLALNSFEASFVDDAVKAGWGRALALVV
jgi:adenine deaminase